MKKFRTVLAASALAVGGVAASVAPASAGVNGIGHHPQPTPVAQHVVLNTTLGAGEACRFPVRVHLDANVRVWQRGDERVIRITDENIRVRAVAPHYEGKHGYPVARPTFQVRDGEATLRQRNTRRDRVDEQGKGAQLLLIDQRISRNSARHASLIFTTGETRSRLNRDDRNEILPLIRLRSLRGEYVNVCDEVAPVRGGHHK